METKAQNGTVENLTDEEKVQILYALAQYEAYSLVVSDWFEGDEKAAADAYQQSESLVRGYMSEIRRINPSFNQPISYLYYAFLDGYHNYSYLFRGQMIDDTMLSKFRFDCTWMTLDHRVQEPKGESSRIRYDNGSAYVIGLLAENLSYNLLSASFIGRLKNWLERERASEFYDDRNTSHAEIYLKCEECARSLVRMCKRLDEGRAPYFISCDMIFREGGIDTDGFKVIDKPLFVELRKRFLKYLSHRLDEDLFAKEQSVFDAHRFSTETTETDKGE